MTDPHADAAADSHTDSEVNMELFTSSHSPALTPLLDSPRMSQSSEPTLVLDSPTTAQLSAPPIAFAVLIDSEAERFAKSEGPLAPRSGTSTAFTDSGTVADPGTVPEIVVDTLTESEVNTGQFADPLPGLETDVLRSPLGVNRQGQEIDNCNNLRIAMSSIVFKLLARRAMNTDADTGIRIIAAARQSYFHLFLLFRGRRRKEEEDTTVSPIQAEVNKLKFRRKN